MASTVELRGKIKVCMFDQYGTRYLQKVCKQSGGVPSL